MRTTRTNEPATCRGVIHSTDEIPEFSIEDEEDAFWATHSLGPELLDRMGPPPEGLPPSPRVRKRAEQPVTPPSQWHMRRVRDSEYPAGMGAEAGDRR